MIIFPAIDLKNGKCVRLIKGDMEQATVFNNSPSDQARFFYESGFEWIHIVDLNGAFSGEPVNSASVEGIINSSRIPVQLGGGIRNMYTIDYWIGNGVSRVILGTAALKNPKLVEQACKKYPGKIIIGVDCKNGLVATEGWADDSDINVIDLAKKFVDVGVHAIIYTDINRDGIMTGPDLEGSKKLAIESKIPVIVSGGVANIGDIEAVKKLEEDGIIGVISGRAIYEGKIDIEAALDIAKS